MQRLCRVPAPYGSFGNHLTLHQEGIGFHAGAVTDDGAVMNERIAADGDPVAQPYPVALERPVLLRMPLQDSGPVERAIVADLDELSLGNGAASFDHP